LQKNNNVQSASQGFAINNRLNVHYPSYKYLRQLSFLAANHITEKIKLHNLSFFKL